MSTIDETEAVPERVDTSDIRPHDESWRQANKYAMKRFPGRKLTMPTGFNIDEARYANVRPPGADDTFILHSPEKIVRHPAPGCRYVWRLRNDDETLGLLETKEMRPVRLEEIVRDRRTAKIIGYVGAGGHAYAAWKRHALFEIGPALAYEWYGHPEEWAIKKMMSIPEQFESDVNEKSRGKMSGRVETRDTRRASEEPRSSAPRRPDSK